MFERTQLLIGKENIAKIQNLNVIVFGIGGVGGYTCEMLARSGVGRLTIVDYDIVSRSNLNRQIIALESTIGRLKVDVMKERINDINKSCQVTSICAKLMTDNIDSFELDKFDYVIDAIDMVTSKINLIEYCHKKGINIVSSMGAGNRFDIPQVEVTDIYSTYNDGLAKVLRSQLRKRGVASHDVVFAKNIASPSGNTIGSIAYFPSVCGSILGAFVINKTIEKEK